MSNPPGPRTKNPPVKEPDSPPEADLPSRGPEEMPVREPDREEPPARLPPDPDRTPRKNPAS
jgi:hypothetical protein